MKQLLLFISLVMALKQVTAQRLNPQPLVKFVKSIFGKAAPEVTSTYGSTFLSRESVARLRALSPKLEAAIPSDDDCVVQHNDKLYLLESYGRRQIVEQTWMEMGYVQRANVFREADNKYSLAITDFTSKDIVTEYAVRRYIAEHKEELGIPEPKTEYQQNVEKIQSALQMFGYSIEVDGIMGPKTKTAIEAAFGVSTKNRSDEEIVKRVLNTTQKKQRAAPSVVYSLKITRAGEGDLPPEAPLELKLTDKELVKELDKFTCGFKEVCASLDKIGGSIDFECADKMGNKVTLHLSSEKSSVQVNFKSPDGQSLKLSVDSDGKLNATHTDGKQSRGYSDKVF